ncbi:MAG TPA: hypothetical protein VMV37_05725, partial [Gammaproteobacteria bacterium]|nr:hypothetical protein [Gammaproteobacteria bacterium]
LLSDGGRRLDVTLEITGDRQVPVVLVKRWLRVPGAALQNHRCDVMSTGLDATLADFIDPATLDARRPGTVETVTSR